MFNTYIARQAILDRNNNTIGYEILFRESPENKFPQIEQDVASSKFIIQNHLQGDINAISMGKLSFINFTENSLVDKYPLLFPKNAIVIELVGHKTPTVRLLNIIKFYHQKGYKIALTEYDLDEKWDVLFPYLAFIKVNIELINPKRIHSITERLRNFNVKLTAEKVESNFQRQAIAEVGFDYFQGFYYHEPEIISKQTLAPLKTQMLLLMSETFNSPLDYGKIANIISHDLNLTVGLLKMVNNVTTSAKVEITSLKQAATYLGDEKLKQFVTILALSELASDQTDEVAKQALITAKLMTSIAKNNAFKEVQGFAFITGVLSAMEVVLSMPIGEIVKTMPLAAPIENALVHHAGLLGELLELTTRYITGQTENITQIIEQYALDEVVLQQDFVAACQWCYELNV